MRLDRKSHIPLYKQAKDRILEYIHSDGRRTAKLPPERELSREMGISTGTIRIALRELVREDLLERVPGKGTFVKDRSRSLRFATWYPTETYTRGPTETALTVFRTLHPEVDLQSIPIPFEKMEHQLMLMTAAGKAPDLASLVYLWLPTFAGQGSIMPLDELPLKLPGDGYPRASEAVRMGGREYGLTWANGPTILFGNGELLDGYCGTDRPDLSSLEAFKEACISISEASQGDIIPFSIPITDDELFFLYSIYGFLLAFGGGIVDEEGDIAFDCGENITAYLWLRDFIRTGGITTENDFRTERMLFARKKAAFSIEAPWLKGIVPTLDPEHEPSDLRFFPIPAGPTGVSASILYNVVLSVFTQCRDKEAACEFIRHLTRDPDITRRYYRESGMLPDSISRTESDPTFQDDFGRLLREQMKSARPIPSNHPSFLLSVVFYAKASREILLGDRNPSTVLRDTAEVVRELYRR
jgi:ABC-type glycerol-3-phosphate transport system substrate-binding protein